MPSRSMEKPNTVNTVKTICTIKVECKLHLVPLNIKFRFSDRGHQRTSQQQQVSGPVTQIVSELDTNSSNDENDSPLLQAKINKLGHVINVFMLLAPCVKNVNFMYE